MQHNEKVIKKAYIELENLCKEIEARIQKAKEIADEYELTFSFKMHNKVHSYADKEWWRSFKLRHSFQ